MFKEVIDLVNLMPYEDLQRLRRVLDQKIYLHQRQRKLLSELKSDMKKYSE